MKKLILSICFVFFGMSLYAQKSADSANFKTAVRCLNLAENSVAGGDWENAFRQAELGLAYDDSISDLYYIKAVALSSMGKIRAEIIPVIEKAFEKNKWTSYSKNGARILYADLLCETGFYEKSIDLLNEEPLVFSADAEYIRIKDYYRMGTEKSLESARLKVNSSRRVFPSDERFPEIFFMFESLYKNSAKADCVNYEVPEIVQIIADSYISKMPDYSDKGNSFEVYAAFLAKDDVRERLIKSISAKTENPEPLLVIAQKEINMISDADAVESFFESCAGTVKLNEFDLLVSLITEDEVKQQIVEKMTNWEGLVLVDENLDLQNELTIKYSLGRPQFISYDSDNDGVNDLNTTCDYGAPVSIYFAKEDLQLFYDQFPYVNKIIYASDETTFNFLHQDFSFTPFEMNLDKVLQTLGHDFYVPGVKYDVSIPCPEDLVMLTSSVVLSCAERPQAKIEYTVKNGELVFARFYENENNYAYCDFTTVLPFVRYADYDNDGKFETLETFDELKPNHVLLEDEKTFMKNVFGSGLKTKNLYLQKVQIDRDFDTNFEFSEEYLTNGGRITMFDYDDNGFMDSKFVKNPAENGRAIVEESVFYDKNGAEVVCLTTLDGIPLKMNYQSLEVMIFSGASDNFYWLEEVGKLEVENYLIEKLGNDFAQGTIEILDYEQQRYFIIRIGKDYFCKKIENFETSETSGAAETSEKSADLEISEASE